MLKKISLFTLAAFFCIAAASSEQITFSANSMSGRIGEKSDSTNLIGEAYVLTESMEISADSISMSGNDFRYIEASGNVKGKNMESQMEFSCGKMKYDRESKIAELFDDAAMKDTKNEVSAKAQIIEYNDAIRCRIKTKGQHLHRSLCNLQKSKQNAGIERKFPNKTRNRYF